MRLFNDLRKNLVSYSFLGNVAHGSGVGALSGEAPSVSLPKAPLYVAGAITIAFALIAAAPHRPVEESSLSQIEWQAKQGSADAELLLALAYRNGQDGLKADAGIADKWLAKAANGGSAYAAGLLGDAYADGMGVTKNHDEAVYWWQQAAREGDPHGTAELKQISAQPHAPVQLWDLLNSSSPARLMQRANAGDSNAQFELAMRYRDGAWGVNPNPRLALEWLQKSVNQGNPVAMQALAQAYAQGELGLTPDQALAAQWRRQAQAANAEQPAS
jgi:TPR repeat protein